MTLSNFLLTFFFATGWRWTLFQYRKTEKLRIILQNYAWGRELLSCPFCQFCEAGLLATITLKLAGTPIPFGLFPSVVLSIGFLGLILEPILEQQIDRAETLRGDKEEP